MKSTYIIKRYLIGSVTGLCLLLATQVHADFRKALDAYQNRDGDTMLKEVKDAVDTKNDDGLMLLLMATNMDAATSDYDETTKQSKSTLRAILPQPKWDEIRELLIQATNNSTLEAQYYLNLENRQFSRELIIQRLQAEQITRGEEPKNEYTKQEMNQEYSNAKKSFLKKGWMPFNDNTSSSTITKQAEDGAPEYQAALGFFNLGFAGDYAYKCEKKDPNFLPLCTMKVDEVKGYEWISKAVQGYENDGLLSEGYGKFSSNMCKFLIEQKTSTQNDMRQAYLWCFMGANLGSGFSKDWLGEMHRAGQLKMVAPELDLAWDTVKRNEVLYVKNIKEWPELVLKARQQLTPENTPVFSYLFSGSPLSYAIEVFSDGRVLIKDMERTGYKTLLKKVSPNHVKEFIAKLHKAGIDGWLLHSENLICDIGCPPVWFMKFKLVEGDSSRSISIAEYDDKGGAAYPRVLQMAKIKSIVDFYFPASDWIIGFGNSGFRNNDLHDSSKWWQQLATQGDTK